MHIWLFKRPLIITRTCLVIAKPAICPQNLENTRNSPVSISNLSFLVFFVLHINVVKGSFYLKEGSDHKDAMRIKEKFSLLHLSRVPISLCKLM